MGLTKDIESVTTISSGNTEIGDDIAKAMKRVKKDGVINEDESRDIETIFVL